MATAALTNQFEILLQFEKWLGGQN